MHTPMHTHLFVPNQRWAFGTLMALTLLHPSSPALADAPIWTNARVVQATHTDCGSLQYLTLKATGVKLLSPPDSPGCKSSEITYRQVNVAKAYLRPEANGPISESNVTAGTLRCGDGGALVILGSDKGVNLAIRQHPAPRGCAFTLSRVQHLSSVGNIPFTNVANGGTMSVKESLALHAKERERAIALCNASAACQAEVSRRSAINAYYDCLKPTEVAHTCTRPW